MTISTDHAAKHDTQAFAAVAGAPAFSFNQEELTGLLSDNPSADKIVFSKRNCQMPDGGTADFLFAQAFKGNVLLDPTDPPNGCPFPPGWDSSLAPDITANMLQGLHKFSVGASALKNLLGTNTFITGTTPTPQVIASIEPRIIPPDTTEVLSIKNLNDEGNPNGSGHIDALAI